MNNKEKVTEIIRRLRKSYPDHSTALNYKTPFELLVATILSAQSTDVQVNKITPSLFRKYKSIRDYAEVPLATLQKDVSSVNFFNNKAKNIQASARMIMDRFGSKVPATMAELVTLPGVARKTANIVLSSAFGINEGIAVDTHVIRLSNRLGLTKHQDPVRIETDLMPVTDKKDWAELSNLLIYHGRNICKAKKPDHANCVLNDICPSRDI